MRRSSVMRPSSSGTLKSTRTSTRFPATSMSRTVCLATRPPHIRKGWGRSPAPPAPSRGLQPELGHVLHQISDAAGVTPFIIVPGKGLHEIVREDRGQRGVHNPGVRAAFEVHGDQFLPGVAEDPLNFLLGGVVYPRFNLVRSLVIV